MPKRQDTGGDGSSSATQAAATPKQTRAHLTLEQKARLRSFLLAHPKLPQFEVADWIREHFHVRLGRTTLYRIQHAPEASFATGNLSRKKVRRVKFPEFERRLLAFCHTQQAQQADMSDDALLRHAAQCRAACGISDAQLKLSNGWLYRFKTRHQFARSPPSSASDAKANADASTSSEAEAASITSDNDSSRQATGLAGFGQVAKALSLEPRPSAQPTACLSARTLTTLQAPGVLNWEPTSADQQYQSHFCVVSDGVLVRHAGVYELSVRVQHSAPSTAGDALAAPGCVFRIYRGEYVVGQCNAPASVRGDGATSTWMTSILRLEGQTLLRVEFLAPGYAFTDSSLVLRWRGPSSSGDAGVRSETTC